VHDGDPDAPCAHLSSYLPLELLVLLDAPGAQAVLQPPLKIHGGENGIVTMSLSVNHRE
jgi:hypothetical protein